ncbi:MAG: 50S ribosomal protein L3 [Patescibacteria group bacterium]
MLDTFYAVKINTTQTFDSKGKRLAITRLKASPLTVAQVKTKAKDGYHALKCSFPKTLKKSYLKEIILADLPTQKTGDTIKVADIFKPGDSLKASGLSIGRGFSGAMKRHGFHGGPKTHGQSDRQRSPGSIGMRTTPGRVWKGHRMAGHYGHETKTIMNLLVFNIDEAKSILTVIGTVPGSRNTLIKLCLN